MAYEIVMPQMGLSMDSGYIVRWIKQPGEQVAVGDLLLEIEGDKATVEVEAVESGILQVVLGPQDGAIAVGRAIGYLVAAGEAAPGQPTVAAAPHAGPMPAAESSGLPHSPEARRPQRAGRPPASPAARRRAQELGLDWRAATGTGPEGAIKERDILRLAAEIATAPRVTTPAAPVAEGKLRISPVARRLADSAGLDVQALAAQHPGKRIEREDVEAALAAAVHPAEPSPLPPVALAPGTAKHGLRRPMSRLRRLIAERMVRSSLTNAAVTLTTEADATDLVRVREGRKADPLTDFVPSYNTLLARLVARALREHPALNATLDGDDIVYWDTVSIAVAVDTDRGLVAPVFHDVQDRPLADLAREMDERLARAREGKALPDELTGSTFTITNLGVYEIDAFTPIINPPEAAILGVGRLVDRIIPYAGQPTTRTLMALSLTFDHRLVDGGPAARFLQRVKQLVEQPYLWLF